MQKNLFFPLNRVRHKVCFRDKLGLTLSFAFVFFITYSLKIPTFSLAQAPYVAETAEQALQSISQSTTGQANLHSNAQTNTPNPQSQTVILPNTTSANAPIMMTVTTNINNPQTQNVPVNTAVNNTATAPTNVQNQNTSVPLAPIPNPCSSHLSAVPQQRHNTADPFGSLCAPSLERNIYLGATFDMLVPRRHLYSSDPAKTSKPEPRIYTRDPLIRRSPAPVALYEQNIIGTSNQKTSNQDLNGAIRERQRQELLQLALTERVTVYPVINRGDGVRALHPFYANNNTSQKYDAGQNNIQVENKEKSNPNQNVSSTINTTSSLLTKTGENIVNSTNKTNPEEIQK